jgi:hypothetical protein
MNDRGKYRVESIINKKFFKLKLLIVAGLLAVIGRGVLQAGFGLLTLFSVFVGVAVILSCFRWQSRPEDEHPCSTVSCCHYLGEHEGNPSHQNNSE